MRIRQGGRSALVTSLVVTALVLSSAIVPVAGANDGTGGGHDFSDVPPTNGYHDEISWMTEQGFVAGYPDGTFRPSMSLSRQHVTQILWRMSGEPTSTLPVPFDDVAATSPFYEAIQWGAATGVILGTPGGRFRPHDTITRQALAAMLHRLSGIEKTYGSRTYPDVPADHPFNTPIAWWVNSGQAKGYSDGTFRPLEVVSREGAAHALATFYEMMGGFWPYFDHSHHAEDCTDPITPEQQQAADDLLAEVITEVAARWPTRQDAIAAGYRVNAPAFAGEGPHMVNDAYSQDGIQLDPTKPESLVLDIDGQTVAAAMFIREAVGDPGPLVGGCLTLWHAHDNLCYDKPFLEGGSVVWLAELGGCRGTAMVRITPEMLHVWVDGRPNPFEGIET